ncbi:uncharacterized protein LOC113636772 isoform X1 [Tachysurus fulvidraco]|uniref:uncharacterized protein LOC113636772 isoform X1 n=2 Tax=Tachysurus fulvidraco TaxID=1234273 RepID=UPI001FEEA0CA|nr:uncharacterized protein LOC113636772 isoform X1 [Tachysurus fulvidraco]
MFSRIIRKTVFSSVTNKSVERSSVVLTEGEDVLLNCRFIRTEGYDNIYFAVYWIKTIEKKSICVHSYDYKRLIGINYNPYCNVQEDLLHRVSVQKPISIGTHNIRISNITESDAGQYLCALRVHPFSNTKVMWKILNNITVNVNKGEIAGNRLDAESLIRLCVTLPIILGVPIAAVVVLLWKKNKTSARSQTMELRTIKDREETSEMSFEA